MFEFVGLLYLILLSCQLVFVCVCCAWDACWCLCCVLTYRVLFLASVQVYDMSTCFYCV
jgi:hypothetical protein